MNNNGDAMKIWTMMMAAWLLALGVAAQARLTGRVTDTSGKPVARAIVKVYGAKGDSLAAYSSTDAKGNYVLTVKVTAPQLRLRVSHLSYRPGELTAENRSQHLPDVRLQPGGQQLREVTVRAPALRITGDTLSYNVNQLKSGDDRNIEDVIRRIPGVTVETNGKIKYNGEDINRFYIEGLNMLGGDYTIATKNVRPDDVSAVEVYQNHQPIQALKDVEFSERAALNLKLKKKSLLRPVGYAKAGAGGGAGTAWTGEAFMMLIAPKHQHMVTLKGGNFGRDYSSEIATMPGFGSGESEPLAASVFNDEVFSSGALPDNRYRRGTSAIASVRNLFKLGESLTMTVAGSYGYGDQQYGSDRTTDYLGAGGERIVVQELGQTSLRHQLGRLNLRLEQNSASLYLYNDLKLRGSFDRNRYLAAGTVNARQRNALDTYGLTDDFRIVRRRGQRAFQLQGALSYAQTPDGHLRAVDTAADSLLADQRTGGRTLRFRMGTSYSWFLSQLSQLGLALTFQAAHDQMDSESSLGQNDARGYQFVTSVGPRYTLRYGMAIWKLQADVQMYDLAYRDPLNGVRYSRHRPYLAPSTSLNLRFSPLVTASMKAGYGVNHGGLSSFVLRPLWVTYREQRTMGDGALPREERFYLNAALNLENSFKGYRVKFSGAFNATQDDLMASSHVSETGTQLSVVNQKNTTRYWVASASYMQNIFDKRMLFSFNASVNGRRSAVLREDVCYGTRSLFTTLNGSMRQTFWDEHIVAQASVSWLRSSVRTDGLADNTHFDNVSAYLNLSVFPVKQFQLYATCSYNVNEMEEGHFRHDLFLDGGMRYMHGHWEAELAARNLTNRRLYVIRSSSLFDVTTDTYRLRPAEALLTLRYNF